MTDVKLFCVGICGAFAIGLATGALMLPEPEPVEPPRVEQPPQTFLGLSVGEVDHGAEERYRAAMAEADRRLAEQEADTARAWAAVEAAEAAVEAIPEVDLTADLDRAGGLLESTPMVLDMLPVFVWQERLAATRQIAENEHERAESAVRLADSLRVALWSVRAENATLRDSLTAARFRVDELTKPRVRWGLGVTAGVPVLPNVEFNRPQVVVGLTLSLS